LGTRHRRQNRDTGNIGHKTQKTKQRHMYHWAQDTEDNIETQVTLGTRHRRQYRNTGNIGHKTQKTMCPMLPVFLYCLLCLVPNATCVSVLSSVSCAQCYLCLCIVFCVLCPMLHVSLYCLLCLVNTETQVTLNTRHRRQYRDTGNIEHKTQKTIQKHR
jgi:uncharacterized protein YlbG (UPF0298 family)